MLGLHHLAARENAVSDHPELTSSKAGAVLVVHVQPGAGRTEVVGRHGAALKIRVGAPPTGGRANEAVVELVAREFRIPASSVSITAGAASRQKRVQLAGVDVAAAGLVIDRILAAPRR
jgi:uncharacterized protein